MVNTSFVLQSKLSVIALVLALVACAPQSPQCPSQRSGQQTEPDSMTLAMVELHQRLADAADIELNRYIQDHPGRWFEQKDGSWAIGIELIDAKHQTSGTIYSLHLITRDLQGNLLSDVQGEYELGKCQLPSSVENCLSAQCSGHFKVLAPWYVAYGSKGNDFIPGYQNVIIEVYIL